MPRRMLKLLNGSLLLLFSFALLSADVPCDWEKLKASCDSELKPYKYYAFKDTRVDFQTESSFKEVQIPLFRDSEYRFIFNTTSLPENIKIQIWNAPARFEGRKMIYEAPSDQKIIVYDPPKTRVNNRIYLNYIIPASEKTEFGESSSGCVVFYSGFK